MGWNNLFTASSAIHVGATCSAKDRTTLKGFGFALGCDGFQHSIVLQQKAFAKNGVFENIWSKVFEKTKVRRPPSLFPCRENEGRETSDHKKPNQILRKHRTKTHEILVWPAPCFCIKYNSKSSSSEPAMMPIYYSF